MEEAAQRVRVAGENGPMRQGPMGMLARMGGRLISFYADDLAEMLLNDFLGETVLDLQAIEGKQTDKIV